MTDTVRTQAELLAIYADNSAGLISAQDGRDFIVSAMPSWWTVVSTPGAKSVDFAGVVTIMPPDATVDDLFETIVPATYVNDSNYGRIWRARYASMGPSEFIYSFGLDKMIFRSAVGEGEANIQIVSSDTGSSAVMGGAAFRFTDVSGVWFNANSMQLGFFDQALVPPVQQTLSANPTGAEIRAVLRAYGLVAA